MLALCTLIHHLHHGSGAIERMNHSKRSNKKSRSSVDMDDETPAPGSL
jgi:hypothetical protein